MQVAAFKANAVSCKGTKLPFQNALCLSKAKTALLLLTRVCAHYLKDMKRTTEERKKGRVRGYFNLLNYLADFTDG